MDLGSLELKIARSENLPVLPQVVTAVLKIADDPNSSPKDIERTVESDPAITAKILRVASSSYYGQNEVPSIARAISVLGINSIRSLVVGVALQQMMAGKTMPTAFSKLELWKHSLAVATAARILGKIKMPGKSDELFGAAMMHDVGLLVLERFCPSELDQALKHANENGVPLHTAERILFGYDHAQIGGLLADRWGLTGVMHDAIAKHHDPLKSSENQEATCYVAVANLLAHQCGFTNSLPSVIEEIDPELLDVVGLPQEQLVVIGKVIEAEVSKAQDAFQISNAA